MGMFDEFLVNGKGYQTKVFSNILAVYELGDKVDREDESFGVLPEDFQACCIDVTSESTFINELIFTVRAGKLYDVDVARDCSLPLFDYYGMKIEDAVDSR